MKKKPSLRTVLTIAALAAMAGLLVLMVIDLLPLLEAVVKNAGNEAEMTSYIASYGAKGIPVLVGLQALQVIIAVIPAAAIQVLAGLCYGTFLGAAICTVGFTAGNTLMFVAFRQFGQLMAPLVESHRAKKRKRRQTQAGAGDKPDEAGKSKRLADRLAENPFVQRLMRRPALAAFVLFAVPGIPDGFILPYIFAKSSITLPRYMLAVAAASVPAMLLFNFLGSRLTSGGWTVAIVIVLVMLAAGAAALIIKHQMDRAADKKAE